MNDLSTSGIIVASKHNESEINKLSKDPSNLSHKDLLNFNTTRRSNGRILKNLQTDRREINLKVKNRISNLPKLNQSIPDSSDFSGQTTSRNIKKSVRKNLIEKLKTFGIHNNATVNTNFVLQSIQDRKEKNSKDSHDRLDDTQKTNANTNPNPSVFESKTRESSHLENKRVSRK